MDWRHQAACRDHDPELWFSGKPYEQAPAPEKPAGIGDNRRES